MLNKVILIGRLGKDPDKRVSKSGTTICSFTVATDVGWGDKKRTEWVNVTSFGKLADIVEKYLSKGSLVYIEGNMRTSQYGNEGAKKYFTEVVCNEMKMLGGKGSPSNEEGSKENTEHHDSTLDFNDDLPF